MTSPKRTIPRTCIQCGVSFLTWEHSVRAGYGNYCSSPCHHESRRNRVSISCERCGETFSVIPSRAIAARYCSLKCKSANYGTDRHIDRHGYAVVLCDDGRKRPEHRVVAERMIERPLRRGEHVHHANEDRTDNSPENLRVLTVSEHISIHKRINGWSRNFASCIQCGETARRHISRGLCSRCYCRQKSRRDHHVSPERYRV